MTTRRTVQRLEVSGRGRALTVVPLATFTVDGDDVTAEYFDPAYRDELELWGIYTPATGEVRPADGAPFFAALELAYRASSRIRVVDDVAT